MKRSFMFSLIAGFFMLASMSLFAQDTARLQVIHNAADPNAEMVDIYLNDTLLLDDFKFRTATEFIDAPAGEEFLIGVAPSTSSSVNDALAQIPVTLEAGKKYVAVANGVLDPTKFAENPDGLDIGFQLIAKDGAREEGMSMDKVDLRILHGATDAPAVDVIARGVAALVEGAPYAAMTDYLSVPPAEYLLDVTPAGMNETIVATFQANLSGLGGGAAVVFASGFLNPMNNMDGKAFGLFAALPNGDVVPLPAVTTARLQVIHNAADPGAEMVDIYVNDKLLLDDFKFRMATEYIDAPANSEFMIGVAPPSSNSVDEAIAKIPVTLMAGESYVAVANGVLDPNKFAENPDGRETAFQLLVKKGAREMALPEMAAGEKNVQFVVLHGATDAPAVDVIARDVAKLVEGAAYSDFTDYITVPADKYLLDITPADMNETIVATFKADLSGLAGGAAVVFASGFLNPMNNMDGKAFGLFAALPNGDVVELMPVTTARLQVIHNAADPGAEMVDIYVNDKLLLDDFKFRTATEYIDAPANSEFMIGVAPPSSNSVDEAIAKIPVTLMAGESYVAIANGVLDPTKFAENPDGRETAFQLFVKKGAREMAKPDMAAGEKNVQFVVLHGATDAPAVDVIARDVAKLVEGAAYADITEYITVPADKYLLDITPAGMNETIVATFKADLSSLAGGAAVVFASGFLNPEANMNGMAFGLFVALPNGKVIELMSPTTARLQVIHNAADPGAKMVDIYLNDKLLLDDFMFRSATPYIDAPADEKFMIGVAPSSSSSVDDAIAQIPVMLESGETYVAIANGVLDPTKFAENPDGKDIAFQLLVKNGAREMGMSEDKVDFVVLHGATDAPGVDVIARDVATLVEGAKYSMITDYISVPVNNYVLDITPAGDNNTIVASFEAPLEGLGGGAAVVFASGFLAPENNMNGMAFGLFAALPNGDVLELPAETSTSVSENTPMVVTEYELQQNYPNPFNPTTTISFAIPERSNVKVIVYDMLGKQVATLVNEERASGAYNVVWNGLDESGFQVASGVYFYALETQNFSQIRRMMLVK